jgi:hypothetical protein
MTTARFPTLALSVGLVLALVLLAAGGGDPAGEHRLPLLMLLLMSELGFIVTAIGAFVGIRGMRGEGPRLASLSVTLGCMTLAVGFVVMGLALWPGTGT